MESSCLPWPSDFHHSRTFWFWVVHHPWTSPVHPWRHCIPKPLGAMLVVATDCSQSSAFEKSLADTDSTRSTMPIDMRVPIPRGRGWRQLDWRGEFEVCSGQGHCWVGSCPWKCRLLLGAARCHQHWDGDRLVFLCVEEFDGASAQLKMRCFFSISMLPYMEGSSHTKCQSQG